MEKCRVVHIFLCYREPVNTYVKSLTIPIAAISPTLLYFNIDTVAGNFVSFFRLDIISTHFCSLSLSDENST